MSAENVTESGASRLERDSHVRSRRRGGERAQAAEQTSAVQAEGVATDATRERYAVMPAGARTWPTIGAALQWMHEQPDADHVRMIGAGEPDGPAWLHRDGTLVLPGGLDNFRRMMAWLDAHPSEAPVWAPHFPGCRLAPADVEIVTGRTEGCSCRRETCVAHRCTWCLGKWGCMDIMPAQWRHPTDAEWDASIERRDQHPCRQRPQETAGAPVAAAGEGA